MVRAPLNHWARWVQCPGPQPYGAHENSLLCSSGRVTWALRPRGGLAEQTQKNNHKDKSRTEAPHSGTAALSFLPAAQRHVSSIAVADSWHAPSSSTCLSSARTGPEAPPHLLQGMATGEPHTHHWPWASGSREVTGVKDLAPGSTHSEGSPGSLAQPTPPKAFSAQVRPEALTWAPRSAERQPLPC